MEARERAKEKLEEARALLYATDVLAQSPNHIRNTMEDALTRIEDALLALETEEKR